jgi:hypothetical protein
MSSVALTTGSLGMSGVKVEVSVVEGSDAILYYRMLRSLLLLKSNDDGI